MTSIGRFNEKSRNTCVIQNIEGSTNRMNNKTLTFICFLILFLSGCNYYHPKVKIIDPPIGEPVTEPTPEKLNFALLNKRVFTPYCVDCHSGMKPAAGFDITDYAGMLEVEYIVPGSPEDSLVYFFIEDNAMPPKMGGLSLENKELVRQWILEGAVE